MKVEDGLAGSLATIDPDVITVGKGTRLNGEASHVYGSGQRNALLEGGLKPIPNVSLRYQ
jgi:hypothetical protein